MSEDFVSFDLAKKLKEKRFDRPCMNAINRFGCTYRNGWCEYLDDRDDEFIIQHDLKDGDYLLPTINQVLKWLREEKNLYVEVHISMRGGWYNMIYEISPRRGFDLKHMLIEEKSYEEAVIAGIEYVLDNLI